MRELRATYRLQLTPAFGFAAARDLVPYLADLGISHLYLSPSLQARAGSQHGYDIVDPGRVSDDLGGEDGLRALALYAHEHGMGVILDVVPNHLCADASNRYWSTPELRDHFFDVDPVTGRWRRFFDIDELAAVRVELPEVFGATHDKTLSLVHEGLVDGLRVDHPDGLADPLGYLERLRDNGVARVWVEKILGVDESLPAEWPVCGTVGYEFLNDLIGLFVAPEALETFDRLWSSVAQDTRAFGAWALEAKLEQAHGPFAPELERLTRENDAPAGADLDGLALALASQPVYRTYVPTEVGFLRRFQQTSPAIMAKGVEDTAFYRYARLVALNEVGGEPGRWSLPVGQFHARNAARAAAYPEALLTTMTHDAKRSADVRARLVALTWLAGEWEAFVARWLGDSVPGPDRIDRYFILQTLVGAWPIEAERIDGYLEKALRESKRHSNWIDQDAAYEGLAKTWVAGLAASEEFTADLDRLLAALGPGAERVTLAWITLKLLSPGVPDTYQGDELAFLALVDPDNRRPVDFDARRRTLDRIRAGGPAGPAPGHRKLKLLYDLLALRARRPESFGARGAYEPVELESGGVAFIRGGAVLAVVDPRSGAVPTAPADGWTAVVALPGIAVFERAQTG